MPQGIYTCTSGPWYVTYIFHWDSFQRFSGKENPGSGALEVQIATMCRENRCRAAKGFFVGFVPCCLLSSYKEACFT